MRCRAIVACIVLALVLAGIIAFGLWEQAAPGRVAASIGAGGTGELARLWREYAISADLDLTNADKKLTAVVVNAPAIRSIPACKIVRITDSSQWDWQYLVFTRSMGRWRFAGHIDLPAQKYAVPAHQFVCLAPDALCLTIRELTCSGTGVLLYEDAWYDWTDGRLRELLRYPVEGHVFGWGLPFGRQFDSTLSYEWDPQSEAYSLAVTFREEFFRNRENGDPQSVFSDRRTAVFAWDRRRRVFRFDVKDSGISPQEMASGWENGMVEFVASHWDRLLSLLDSGTPEERQWVFDLLDAGCRP